MMPAFHQIGRVHSPFQSKFALPRQPGLIQGNLGKVELFSPWDRIEALQGLEGFSHLWILFVFHQAIKSPEDWRPTVRPPREGGPRRQGVFASRSPYRPNPIGLSLVGYRGWHTDKGRLFLDIADGDMLDGTPVLDIKPYLPYADVRVEALGGFAHQAPISNQNWQIAYTAEAQTELAAALQAYPNFQVLMESVLTHNPRPLHFGHIQQRERFRIPLYEFEVVWRIQDSLITIERILYQ
jgi:tRNA-Thr(GGU) m(6)t(6)A37 methyltransferase TsaA